MDGNMASFIEYFNFSMFLLFTLLYSYQIVYKLVALKGKWQKKSTIQTGSLHKYAVIIAARNEELVIGQLIKSIKNQNYPEQLIDIFVMADNCTDQTAQVAEQAGAIVRQRFNKVAVGKGYALDYMLKIIDAEYADRQYAGYFVFDADNLLDENYIAEMNHTFNEGYKIITSYRNSKNFDHNWISAGYGLWFLHEAEYLNLPRTMLKTSCAVSGTGFLVHADVFKKNGGWVHHLLTEDIEFSVSQIIQGEKIGYCRNAMFYDEQPVTFSQSWHQRMRWAKGFYQVFSNYGLRLFQGIVQSNSNKLSCYDMTMTIMPAMLVSTISLIGNGLFLLVGIFELVNEGNIVQVASMAILKSFAWYYVVLFLLGFMTTLTEWRNIHCAAWKKIAYTFTFPIFMFTYLPISIVALFKKVEWKPIAHTVVKSLDDVR